MTKPAVLVETLFSVVGEGESLYAILDSAQNHEIPVRLRMGKVEHNCLYEGGTAEVLWYVAPYLLRCERDSEFFRWVLEKGWGQSWGIFLISRASLEDLLQHFRQHLIAKVEGQDKDFYFRFYDPRVLRVYLPTCTAEEATEFFGPVGSFMTEAREDRMMRFSLGTAGLNQSEHHLEKSAGEERTGYVRT